jgi:hypothetical protein
MRPRRPNFNVSQNGFRRAAREVGGGKKVGAWPGRGGAPGRGGY